MALEVELKLLLPVTGAASLFTQIVAFVAAQGVAVQDLGQKKLLNAYFDSDDDWFRRHDIGLRSRQYRQSFEQTLKLPGSTHGAAHIRPEYNVPVSGVRPQLDLFPVDVWPAGTDVSQLQQQLRELFRTDFDRHSLHLQLPDGSSCELVFDQGLVLADGRSETICEIELELQQGDVAALFRLAGMLVQQFPLQLGVQSKAERGYRLSQQQPLSWQAENTQTDAARWLALFLRNQLVLRHQPTDLALQAALAAQWQRWQQWLAAQPAATVLSAAARDVSPEQAPALQYWLLRYSAWLVEPALLHKC